MITEHPFPEPVGNTAHAQLVAWMESMGLDPHRYKAYPRIIAANGAIVLVGEELVLDEQGEPILHECADCVPPGIECSRIGYETRPWTAVVDSLPPAYRHVAAA